MGVADTTWGVPVTKDVLFVAASTIRARPVTVSATDARAAAVELAATVFKNDRRVDDADEGLMNDSIRE